MRPSVTTLRNAMSDLQLGVSQTTSRLKQVNSETLRSPTASRDGRGKCGSGVRLGRNVWSDMTKRFKTWARTGV